MVAKEAGKREVTRSILSKGKIRRKRGKGFSVVATMACWPEVGDKEMRRQEGERFYIGIMKADEPVVTNLRSGDGEI